MLPANKHADSSAKFAYASRSAVHRAPWSAEPWTSQLIKNIPYIWQLDEGTLIDGSQQTWRKCNKW
jgi:hypothetical protein